MNFKEFKILAQIKSLKADSQINLQLKGEKKNEQNCTSGLALVKILTRCSKGPRLILGTFCVDGN